MAVAMGPSPSFLTAGATGGAHTASSAFVANNAALLGFGAGAALGVYGLYKGITADKKRRGYDSWEATGATKGWARTGNEFRSSWNQAQSDRAFRQSQKDYGGAGFGIYGKAYRRGEGIGQFTARDIERDEWWTTGKQRGQTYNVEAGYGISGDIGQLYETFRERHDVEGAFGIVGGFDFTDVQHREGGGYTRIDDRVDRDKEAFARAWRGENVRRSAFMNSFFE